LLFHSWLVELFHLNICLDLKLILQPDNLVLERLDGLNKSDDLLIFFGKLAIHHEKLLGFHSAGAWRRDLWLYEKIFSLLNGLLTTRSCD
jgi:hypothetical protein